MHRKNLKKIANFFKIKIRPAAIFPRQKNLLNCFFIRACAVLHCQQFYFFPQTTRAKDGKIMQIKKVNERDWGEIGAAFLRPSQEIARS